MKIEKYTKKNGETAYRFRVYVGKMNGVSRYAMRSGFSTKAQARVALLKLQEEIDNPPTAKTILFKQVAHEWLDEYFPTVQESTYIKTQRMLANHILPALGSMTLEQLTPLLLHEQMKVWVNRLKNGRKHKGLISNIFKFAIRKGYTTTNPMDSVTVVAVRRTKEAETDFYDKAELKTFLSIVQATEDKRWIAYFRLLAFTGVRKGEIGALDWEDLVPKTLTLSINKAVTRGLGGLEIGLPKTASSKRLISLDQATVEAVLEYKTTTSGKGLMFPSEDGGIMTDSLPRKWMHQLLRDQELRPITIHGFRHTHASLCFEAGMTLKQVQHRLGHSDLKTTMNIYTHITKQAKDDLGEKFSSYIDF